MAKAQGAFILVEISVETVILRLLKIILVDNCITWTATKHECFQCQVFTVYPYVVVYRYKENTERGKRK